MSGIFGLVRFDGSPVAEDLQRMERAMSHWGPDGSHRWSNGTAGLGYCSLADTPEAVYEQLPYVTDDGRLAFTAEARLDNREELFDLLSVPIGERSTWPDGRLILRAYEQWGDECPDRLLGDWSFAAWHPRSRRLFLARDHHGKTALCYVTDGRRVAFASDKQALLCLADVPRRLNELYLAQVLVPGHAFHGRRTIYEDVYRLPPAHALSASPEGLRLWQYWRLEDTPEIRLRSEREYDEAFLDVLGQAVRGRLRSRRPVGVMLSGGLDSGSVAAIAAAELRKAGRVLHAFTMIPTHDVSTSTPADRFGNEWEMAHAVAVSAGNIEHVAVDARDVSPLDGVQRMLEQHGELIRGVGNYYWIVALLLAAGRRDVGALLDGQAGNGTISWAGLPRRRWFGSGHLWKSRRRRLETAWRSQTAINMDFARRVGLAERFIAGGEDVAAIARLSDRDGRAWVIRPGRSSAGALSAELSAGSRLDLRDPTADRRVMAFTFSVPADAWRGPMNRWLLRRAMSQLLPAPVRLNPRRGSQNADIVYRLRAHASETDRVLSAFKSSSIVEQFLDLERLRRVAETTLADDSPATGNLAQSVLLRGLGAGLFLLTL